MQRIEHLLNILDTIKQHGDPAAAEWFSAAVDQYMTKKKESLDDALDLKSVRGRPVARTRYQKEMRNEYLRKAFDLISPEMTNEAKRCELLTQEIKDFEARIYPRWIRNGGPPETASQLRSVLFHAKRTGQPVSMSVRHIRRIVIGW